MLYKIQDRTNEMNEEIEYKKIMAQKAFEEIYSHEKFIEIFKNNYL